MQVVSGSDSMNTNTITESQMFIMHQLRSPHAYIWLGKDTLHVQSPI